MKKKDMALITANIAAVAILMNVFSIPLISPEPGTKITEIRPEFVWGGLAGHAVLYLDDDPDFRSPVEWEIDGHSFRPDKPLGFGTYYWKVNGRNGLESLPSTFTVVSEVSVSRTGDMIVNTGNTNIFVSAVERNGMVTGMVLGINQSTDIRREENVTAWQL